MNIKEVLKISGIPVFVASLCCLSPLVLVMLGLSTVTFAGSLADTLYGTYKWYFRGVGILFLIISIILYLRKKDLCTLDALKRKRNQIINIVLLTATAGVAGYFFFLYIVVHYIGVWFNIWK